MTEAQFSQKLLRALRSHPALRDAIIWKLNDRTTKGIPDVCIVLNGATTWFELKVWPNKPTKIQQHYLKRLKPRSHLIMLIKDCVNIDNIVCTRAVKFDFMGKTVTNISSFENSIKYIIELCKKGV